MVATDAAGNSNQQTVTLDINDVDENATPITSGATAAPIDENSGADQIVYTATAGEAVTWSLAPGGDAADFQIDADSGEVTLIVDPDHETQPSYAFTVVATNAANNTSQQAVSLTINDLDESPPTITSADTADAIDENSGAGQVVYTVTSTDAEDVSTGNTTFSLAPVDDSAAFNIDANTGAVSLIADPDFEDQPSFEFTVVATDAAGNSSQQAVTLEINDVDDEQPTTVDTDAPTLDSSSPADDDIDVLVDDDIVLTFAEDVTAASGDITISNGTDTQVIDVTDATQVTVDGAVVTIDPADDLEPDSTYNVQVDADAFVDTAGNGYAGISDADELNFDTETAANSNSVVFDLTESDSSDQSGRQFDTAISDDFSILADSDSTSLATVSSAQHWNGAENLGSDDRVILVSDGAPVEGPDGQALEINGMVADNQFASLETAGGTAAMFAGGFFDRTTAGGVTEGNDSAQFFANVADDEFLSDQNAGLDTGYLADMPLGILTSQGLV